jgi:hypothetical protein
MQMRPIPSSLAAASASIVVMDAMRMQIPGGRAVSMVLCD